MSIEDHDEKRISSLKTGNPIFHVNKYILRVVPPYYLSRKHFTPDLTAKIESLLETPIKGSGGSR